MAQIDVRCMLTSCESWDASQNIGRVSGIGQRLESCSTAGSSLRTGSNRAYILVDSHCHLDFPEHRAYLHGVLSRMGDNCVTHAPTITTTLETWPAVREVAGAS